MSHATVPTFSIASGSFQSHQDQASSELDSDLRRMHAMLTSRGKSQIQNIYVLSSKIVAGMREQKEKNSQKITECYQQLSKYTRMSAANKRRTLPAGQAKVSQEVNDMDSRAVVVDDGEYNETLKEVNYGQKKYQLPASLAQELGFYLLVCGFLVFVNLEFDRDQAYLTDI